MVSYQMFNFFFLSSTFKILSFYLKRFYPYIIARLYWMTVPDWRIDHSILTILSQWIINHGILNLLIWRSQARESNMVLWSCAHGGPRLENRLWYYEAVYMAIPGWRIDPLRLIIYPDLHGITWMDYEAEPTRNGPTSSRKHRQTFNCLIIGNFSSLLQIKRTLKSDEERTMKIV